MSHSNGYRKLNRTHEHRKRCSRTWWFAIRHEQIKTTFAKNKNNCARSLKLITSAKRGDLHARRQAHSQLKQDIHTAAPV